MIPAIYHLEDKVIPRGVGRSAVAASAYMSYSEIINEYDGAKYDYTKKEARSHKNTLSGVGIM